MGGWMKKPDKLCQDCKFIAPDTGKYNRECHHPKAIRYDFVTGNQEAHTCDSIRKYGPCYEDGRLFELTEEKQPSAAV